MTPRTKKPAAKAKAKTTVTKTVTTTVTTTTTTGQLKNRIGIIVDSSSSMVPMRNEVIAAFNAQVEAIRANNKDMDTKVSFLTFSDAPHGFKVLNQPVETLQKLTEADYNPNGWTALYDAIGEMLNHFQSLPEANDPNCSFLLFIVTDGEENRSRIWNYQSLTQRIKSLETTGRWTFTYLGAGEGLKDVGSTIGVSWSNTFTGANLRMPGAYATVASVSTRSFMNARMSGQSASDNFFNTAELQAAGVVGDQTTDPNDPNKATVTSTTTPKVGSN